MRSDSEDCEIQMTLQGEPALCERRLLANWLTIGSKLQRCARHTFDEGSGARDQVTGRINGVGADRQTAQRTRSRELFCSRK
jgi:hypothetical protein